MGRVLSNINIYIFNIDIYNTDRYVGLNEL